MYDLIVTILLVFDSKYERQNSKFKILADSTTKRIHIHNNILQYNDKIYSVLLYWCF